ncbi:hypothetical protein NDI85_21240 [Halomicroarcula sp. S1AR25-4]|uniref:hypothetical protein n=1 Tax=Haloarcula sp. S1AR25-4 TaxID=2950538 RepID=UPI002874B668|nr:hypothetical protein [Halomicroarcula sp. S1AR25-4]MDS0280313.1 hypothetical protein [Halomicroarcula sp. S1AR25-4]
MVSDAGRTAADARHETRRRREQRTDAVLKLPFGERVTLECPECGQAFETIIASEPRTSPSFDSCPNWNCDAFFKFRSDGTESGPADAVSSRQAGLAQFSDD